MPPNPHYYLFDDKNERVPVAAETSYAISPVFDRWKIVWRLVTVCNAPTGLPHRLDKLFPHGSPSPATV